MVSLFGANMFFIAQLATRMESGDLQRITVPPTQLTPTQEQQIRRLASFIGADPQRTIDIMRNSTVSRQSVPGQQSGVVGVTYSRNLPQNETHPQTLAREFASRILSEAYFQGTTPDLSPEALSRALYLSRDQLTGPTNSNGFLGARTTAWIRSEAQRIGVPERDVAAFQQAILASVVLVDPDVSPDVVRNVVVRMIGDARLADAAMSIGSNLQRTPPAEGQSRAEYWIRHEDAVALRRQRIQDALRAGSAIARTSSGNPAVVMWEPRPSSEQEGAHVVASAVRPAPVETPAPPRTTDRRGTPAPGPTVAPSPPVVAPTPRVPTAREPITLIERNIPDWLPQLRTRLDQIPELTTVQKNNLVTFFQALNTRYSGSNDRLSGLGARRINDFLTQINEGTPVDAARDFVRRMV